jgi:hypothetical protein
MPGQTWPKNTCWACSGGGGAPAEFGGQHLPARGADPRQFAGRARAVGEHGDGFGDDDVERVVAEGERADIARPDRDPAGLVGGADVGFGAFQHERGDVHCGDPRAVTAGDLDGGGGYPAADVEYLDGRGDPSAGEQRLRGCPAARVDDSFPNGGHELVRVQGRYLAGRELRRHRPSPSSSRCLNSGLPEGTCQEIK